MEDEYSIDQEIGNLLKTQAELDPTSKEYKDVTDLVKLMYDLRVAENKSDHDYEIRLAEIEFKREELNALIENRKVEAELRRRDADIAEEANKLKGDEIKEAKRARWTEVGMTFVKVGTFAVVTVAGGILQYTMHKEDNDLKQKGFIIKDSTRPGFIENMSNFVKNIGKF